MTSGLQLALRGVIRSYNAIYPVAVVADFVAVRCEPRQREKKSSLEPRIGRMNGGALLAPTRKHTPIVWDSTACPPPPPSLLALFSPPSSLRQSGRFVRDSGED